MVTKPGAQQPVQGLGTSLTKRHVPLTNKWDGIETGTGDYETQKTCDNIHKQYQCEKTIKQNQISETIINSWASILKKL